MYKCEICEVEIKESWRYVGAWLSPEAPNLVYYFCKGCDPAVKHALTEEQSRIFNIEWYVWLSKGIYNKFVKTRLKTQLQ